MISLIITLVILGLVFWFLEQIPMDPVFKTGIRVLAIIIVLFLVLQALGIPTGFPPIR